MRAAFRLLGAVLALSAASVLGANSNNVRVTVLSKVDEELGVYWINTWNKGALVRQKEDAIPSRGTLNVDSYVGHSFLIVDEKHTEGLANYDASVWNPKIMSMFTMGEFDLEANVSRDENGEMAVDLESALTRTSALMAKATKVCRETPVVVKAMAKRKGLAAAEGSCTISDSSPDPFDVVPEFAECLTKAVAQDLAKKEGEANKSMRMLETVGDRARNYTCADPLMETSNTSLKVVEWLDPVGGLTYQAQMFLDEPSAKVFLLDNFATETECKALKEKASAHLQDATVNGGGKATLSQARRAKAGGVAADLDNPDSKTAGLYRRGYAFANHMTGYGLQLPGQEGFSVIKYSPDDEYQPHCDGDCTGMEFQQGGRVSTLVIYCEQAEVGGGTTFSSSDVFINGKKGQAVFFSYLGPDNKTDIGRTRHSGCPIIKGTKWIATLWMRKGVTAERGWQYYDPSGRPSALARSNKNELLAEERVDEKREAGTVTEKKGEEANGSASSEGGSTDQGEGILSGIAGSISSLFS